MNSSHEILLEILRKDVDYGRKQGLPHLLHMQQALIALIAESGRTPEVLSAAFKAALDEVKDERFQAMKKHQEALANREEDWEQSARLWMGAHVRFPGVSNICQNQGTQVNMICGGSVDFHEGLIKFLMHRTNESEFGSQSRDEVMKAARSLITTTGKCTKCGTNIQIPISNIKIII